MKDFDIAKYLREHQLGSYGILNRYVDLKPLKEDANGNEYINSAIDSIVIDTYGYPDRNSSDAQDLKSKIKKLLPQSNELEKLLISYGEEVLTYNRAAADPHGLGGQGVQSPSKQLRDSIVNLLKKLDPEIDKLLKEYSQEEWGPDGEEYPKDMRMNYEDTQNPSEDFKTAAEKALNSYNREKEKLFQSAAYQKLKADFPDEVDAIEALATDERGDYANRGDSRRAVIQDYIDGKLDLSSMNENAYEGPEHSDVDRIEGLINRTDLRNLQASVVNIFDELTDQGFPAEDVAEYLTDQIRRAADPYITYSKRL